MSHSTVTKKYYIARYANGATINDSKSTPHRENSLDDMIAWLDSKIVNRECYAVSITICSVIETISETTAPICRYEWPRPENPVTLDDYNIGDYVLFRNRRYKVTDTKVLYNEMQYIVIARVDDENSYILIEPKQVDQIQLADTPYNV